MPNFVDVGGSTRIDASAPDPDNPHAYPDDAFPAVIEDQRHAYGCETAQAVRDWQAAWLAGEVPPHAVIDPRWPRRKIAADPDKREVVPHINASRWIGECPACGAANAVWDRSPSMVCLGRGCGLEFKVVWQPPKVRAEAIRVMADWPTEHRSWDAHKGETVDELKIQAVLMQGVAPDLRNGLVVAAGVKMPDDLTSPGEYLDRLRTHRIKAAKGL